MVSVYEYRDVIKVIISHNRTDYFPKFILGDYGIILHEGPYLYYKQLNTIITTGQDIKLRIESAKNVLDPYLCDDLIHIIIKYYSSFQHYQIPNPFIQFPLLNNDTSYLLDF